MEHSRPSRCPDISITDWQCSRWGDGGGWSPQLRAGDRGCRGCWGGLRQKAKGSPQRRINCPLPPSDVRSVSSCSRCKDCVQKCTSVSHPSTPLPTKTPLVVLVRASRRIKMQIKHFKCPQIGRVSGRSRGKRVTEASGSTDSEILTQNMY